MEPNIGQYLNVFGICIILLDEQYIIKNSNAIQSNFN